VERLAQFAFVEGLLDVLVAESDNGLVGHVITTRSFDVQLGAPTRWIADLYVEPSHRSRGLGRKLMAAVARQAVGEGAACLQWFMAPGNEEAERFYEGIGARRDKGIGMFLRSQEFDALFAAAGAE
jgi:GNAT superfamily N-acetyltransferase